MFVSIVLLALTYNPLIAGFLPYLKAGWPAVRTGFWLKRVDPWRARGTVGLLFHLCMALFRASLCGLAWLFGTLFYSIATGNEPDMVPGMIALSAIFAGSMLSTLLCWVGIVVAVRHGVRIFVATHLSHICKGDFTVAQTQRQGGVSLNPGRFIVVVATLTPILTLWFAAILTTVTNHWNRPQDPTPMILILLLPFLCLAGILLGAWLAERIMAKSPAECWGAQIPESEKVDTNWYQSAD